jgi:hypothetical protein
MSLTRIAAFALLTIALSACSKTDTTSADATSSPGAASSPDAMTSPAATTSPDATASSDSTTAVTESPTPLATGSAIAAAAPAFTDIAGVNGEKEIVGFAQLGVIDPVSGAFHPGAPVKRREFIRWLVKANNVLWAGTPAKRINLADSTENSAFPDVKTSDPDFPYIQGMQDAGYSVGFPDKMFRPDDPLTREQMFAIKNVFDRGSIDVGLTKDLTYTRTAMAPWNDKASISKTYVAAITTGDGGGATSIALVFGSAALFRPQLPVTRAQAVVVMSVIGDHTVYGGGKRTLDQALAAAAATPTSTP